MKNKLILILLLTPALLHAQRYPTGKGTFRSGGGFSFSYTNETDESIYKFTITPRVGYFLTENLLVGFITNYTLQVGTQETLISAIKFTPEFKYYWTITDHKFYILGNLQYTIDRKSDFTKTKVITDNSTVGIGPGVAYFFSRRIGFEVNILYTQYLHPDDTFSKVTTDFGFIFHILDKHGKLKTQQGNDKNDYEKELDIDDDF